MHLYEYDYDTFAVHINLVMAIGLVVDYSAHIVHAFFYEYQLQISKIWVWK